MWNSLLFFLVKHPSLWFTILTLARDTLNTFSEREVYWSKLNCSLFCVIAIVLFMKSENFFPISFSPQSKSVRTNIKKSRKAFLKRRSFKILIDRKRNLKKQCFQRQELKFASILYDMPQRML